VLSPHLEGENMSEIVFTRKKLPTLHLISLNIHFEEHNVFPLLSRSEGSVNKELVRAKSALMWTRKQMAFFGSLTATL